MAKPFSEVISITPISPSIYTSERLQSEWCVGNVPNGGYTASLFASVAVTHSKTTGKADSKSPFASQPDVLHLSLHFFRRTYSDHPGHFTVKNCKLGSTQSVIHITLTQPSAADADKSLVEGYATLGNFKTEKGFSTSLPKTFLTPSPLPVDLKLLESQREDKNWLYKRSAFIKFRRSSQHQQTYLPKIPKEDLLNWKGIGDQWTRFTPYSDLDPSQGPSKWTNACLPYVVDNFPPIIEQILSIEAEAHSGTPNFWYPTLSLVLDVKKLLPPEGVDWLFVRCRPKVINNGRMDLDVVVADEQGDIVAVATHSTLILDASRNTQGRSRKASEKQNL